MSSEESEIWADLLIDSGLGRYQPQELRSVGAFGLVFQGIDTRTSNTVAIKVLRPGSDGINTLEFEGEGRLLEKLSRSSNVVSLFESSEERVSINSDLGLTFPIKYHVLELAAGSLDELLADERSRNALSWVERLRLWRDVVKGVHQMHLHGCVHRDIKSSNCLLFIEKGNRTRCKISDLGRSRNLAEPPRLSLGDYLLGRGDLRFAPPEFLHLQGNNQGEALKLGDLYGLGSLLYEFGTGLGVTSIALGYGPELVERNVRNFRKGYAVDLSGLRSNYTPAFALFSEALPSVIRGQGSRLIQQLCDPVPAQRLPIAGLGRRGWRGPGLEWLLRQSDIMIRSLDTSTRRGGYGKPGRAVT